MVMTTGKKPLVKPKQADTHISRKPDKTCNSTIRVSLTCRRS